MNPKCYLIYRLALNAQTLRLAHPGAQVEPKDWIFVERVAGDEQDAESVIRKNASMSQWKFWKYEIEYDYSKMPKDVL